MDQEMGLTQKEVQSIANIVIPIFDDVLLEYDFSKYPATDYVQFKKYFSALNLNNPLMEDALKWKWGHWGKNNFPAAQKELIKYASSSWNSFVTSNSTNSPENTYIWWSNCLVKRTRYISTAYITHLVHHAAPLPIIDQHNFRAMNHLVSSVRNGHKYKKKPSNWRDIDKLTKFMDTLLPYLPGKTYGVLDRFLMMYGRSHVPR